MINTTAYNVDPPPPGGLEGFGIRIGRPNHPLYREACFEFIVHVLVGESYKGFDGSLEKPTTVFRDGSYPHLEITIAAIQPGQLLPRRFFYWGMAKIIEFMVEREAFFERHFLLTWQGVEVGSMTWKLVHIPDQLMIGCNATTLKLATTAQTDMAISSGGENFVSWICTCSRTSHLLLCAAVFQVLRQVWLKRSGP